MKVTNKLSVVVLGMSLLLASGMALADATQKEAANEATNEDNARGIEKSDIKRGMDIKKPKVQQAGDPIPGIDITVNQGHSVCQENCDQQTDAVKKGGSKFKAGKALADTVKKVDDGGDDVDHVDEDSDDDGLLDQ